LRGKSKTAHHDAWLRAKADAENARRRALDEIDKARKFALDKFAADLLPVKDSLEAALATGDNASIESLKSGVELTLKQLATVFDKNSIKELNPLGEKFDPNYHQAIATGGSRRRSQQRFQRAAEGLCAE
jgi:molecular chaperone GrpE